MNTSIENNATLSIEELNELERSQYLPLTILLVVIMTIGIFGNLLVVVVYKGKFKRTSARVYILSLAISDLAVCIVGIPYHVLDHSFLLTYTNRHVCKGLSFLIGSCTLSSVFILLVVGLDRFLKVCRPLKKQIVDFGDWKACLIAVFVATVISIPHGILYGHSSVKTDYNNMTGVECYIDDDFQGSVFAVGYLGFNLLFFVFAVIFLIIIYGLICRKIYQQDKLSGEINIRKGNLKACCCFKLEGNDDNAENDEEMDSEKDISEEKDPENRHLQPDSKKLPLNPVRRNKRETMIRHTRPGTNGNKKHSMKITLMMMTITVVFIIAYFPFIIISILDTIYEEFWTDLSGAASLIVDFFLRIYVVNNMANPIIYSFWDDRFRKESIKVLKTLLCCFKSSKSTSELGTGNTQTYTYTRATEEITMKQLN